MEKALALRSAAGVEVPGQAEHNALIKSYVEACWVWGHTHGLEEMERFNRRREVQFNDPPKPDNRGPAPAEAIKWAEQRVALQGNWHRSLDAQVTQAIVTGLETGATNKDVMGALGRIFPTFSKLRLENIARTESVAAYNQGRLTAFRSNRYVVAVQFASILDSRTTKICRARDGMIMRMEDDRLPANTPPLHFMCRSTIVPVDKFDFEDLQNGVEAVEKQYFGWLDKSGPQSLTQATSAWDDTPKPLPGFGSVHDIGKPKPAAPPAPVKELTLKERFDQVLTQGGVLKEEDIGHEDLIRAGKVIFEEIEANYAKVSDKLKRSEEKAQAVLDHITTAIDENPDKAYKVYSADKEYQRLQGVRTKAELAIMKISDDGVLSVDGKSKSEWEDILENIRESQRGIALPIVRSVKDELETLTKLREKAEKSLKSSQDKNVWTWNEIVKDKIQEVRSLGGEHTKFTDNTKPEGKKMLQSALKYFPSEWVEDIKDRKVKIKINPGRISECVNVPGVSFIDIPPKKQGFFEKYSPYNQLSTTVHETAHMMEGASMEKEPLSQRSLWRQVTLFLEDRTKGETASPLRNFDPDAGFDDNEITKPDGFGEAYTGKQYVYPDHTIAGLPHPKAGVRYATEILSTGLDAVFFREHQILEKDRSGHVNFTLGVLAWCKI